MWLGEPFGVTRADIVADFGRYGNNKSALRRFVARVVCYNGAMREQTKDTLATTESRNAGNRLEEIHEQAACGKAQSRASGAGG